jgi:putative ABC transport system ATP-binding protein
MTAVVSPGPPRPAAGDLALRDVRVAYDDLVALRDITLAVPAGTMLAVTGPSGAGKSSLLWAMAGAVRPASGCVRLGPEVMPQREQAARLGVALVPQGNGLAVMLTAAENTVVPLLQAGVPAPEAWERAGRALAAVGLEDSGHHLIEELSGGQQQRVAVARALAGRHTVILADEPTSDLDSANRERVIDLLRAEAAAGAIVVMSTHDPEAAARADAEVALDEGVMTWVRAER